MRNLDWPERMADAIALASRKPFSESYFCATFAADVVLAITGIDYISSVRGLSQDAAEDAISAEFGSVEAYLEHCFGSPVITAHAQRGDVIVKRDDTGFALGICCGINSAFAGEDGLLYFKTLDCEKAYSVP